MNNMIMRFLKDEQGQDLIEYTLLMAFIALASAAVFISAGSSVNKIWGSASTSLSNAASTAAS
jgi:Flp pilus assembly pilin Flp